MRVITATFDPPPTVRAGDTLEFRIALAPSTRHDEPIAIDGASVTFRGRVFEPNRSPSTDTIVEQTIDLSGTTSISSAGRVFDVSFDIPRDAPPTYADGIAVGITYRLSLHVRIPWHFDLREEREVRVLSPVRERVEARPVIAVPRQTRVPFVEVTIDDIAFAPGETIDGWFAVGNLHAVDGLELALVAHEGRSYAREARRHVAFRQRDVLKEGRADPIHLRVPDDAPTSFESEAAFLRWFLEARLDARAESAKTRIPLEIVRFSSPRSESGVRAAVGAARWSALWRDVARRRGWESSVETTAQRAFSACSARVERTPDAASISAELRWTSWELGVDVNEPAGLTKTGRDRKQTALALEPMKEALRAFSRLSLRDDGARIVCARSPFDVDEVDAALREIEALCDAIEATSNAIVPPTSMRAHLEAWRAAHAAMGGRLCVGSMSLRELSVEGTRADIETLFDGDGDATGTRLVVHPDARIPQSFIELPWRTVEGLVDETTAHAVRTLIADDTRTLRLGPDRIALDLPEKSGDPRSLRDTLVTLVELARALAGGGRGGPYR